MFVFLKLLYKKNLMKKFYSFSLIVLASLSYAQVSLTALNTAYTQNFDGLANSGTSNSTTLNGTLAGWYIVESGTSGNTTYAADTGSLNTGNTYSYGSSSSTERALGSLASNNLQTKFGAQFTNNTGNTIDQLVISYTGEQWRLGDVARATKDQIVFEYSTDATSLTTGTWTEVTALKYETTVIQSGVVGARDGNNATFRTSLSNTITGLNISAGQTFWVRFSDINISGTDDGLGVDDFSLTAKNSSLSVGDISKSKNIFLKNTMVDNTLSFQTKGNASVKVYNANGQLVKSVTISAQNANVDVASLPKGNYVVTAELNGEKVSQKVIKK